MDRDNQLLLDVWREACQHIEIGELVDRVAPILFERLPLDLVLVRHLDIERECVETVAVGARQPGLLPARSKTECSTPDIERLLASHKRQMMIRGTASEVHGNLQGLLPPGLTGNVVAGPLGSEEGNGCGWLVLISSTAADLHGEDHQVLQVLLEPLTVALENDRRVRELTRLREAAEAENRSLLTKLGRTEINDKIVGADSGLSQVMTRVDQVARSDVPVLIFGETGSGKEVVARAIHTRSRREPKPFLRVNCGAIPSELIDSELFGHERGSFTGAVGTRRGWFERADGGTLFLDECGELPLAAQVRLLRILQDGSFSRVGSEKQIVVDVRIIAATNRDLHEMVADGRFRQDLWYRLAVFPIRLPSLRDRTQDIPAMAAHFSLRAAERLGVPPLVPTSEDISQLIAYPWPGNVRELRAVIERAAILGDGKRLEVAKALGNSLPPIQTNTAPATPGIVLFPRSANGNGDFPTLDMVNIRHIESALERTRGRIDGPYGAAELLDINPHTLRARMRKLKIDWRSFRSPPPTRQSV